MGGAWGGIVWNSPCPPSCLGVCAGLKQGWDSNAALPAHSAPCPQPRGHLQACPSLTQVGPELPTPIPSPAPTTSMSCAMDRPKWTRTTSEMLATGRDHLL